MDVPRVWALDLTVDGVIDLGKQTAVPTPDHVM